MSQTYHLDRVIQRVNPPLPKPNPHEKIVIIDANTGKILPKNPLMAIGRDLRYYRVSTRNAAECQGPVCKIKDLGNERAITINMVYGASCPPGNEEQVVRALYQGEHPMAALNQFIERWVMDFAIQKKKLGIDVIGDYFRLRPELQGHLIQQAQEEVGLNLEVKLSLEHETQLTPFAIHSAYFPVRVRDCDDEFTLRFKTELKVNDEHKINAILHYHRLPQLESLLKERMKKSLLESEGDSLFELDQERLSIPAVP